MRIEKSKNEKGLTFAEVIICVFIVALVIGPMTASFVVSDRNREGAERLEKATVYAEWLLEDIKSTMTDDIIEQQKREGNALKLDDLSPDQVTRYTEVIRQYLKSGSLDKTLTVSKFLGVNEAGLASQLETNKYAYEVLIWNIDGAPITSNKLTLNDSALSTAFKLYTSESYKLTSTDSNLPVTFSVSDNVLKTFKDSTKRYFSYTLTNADKKFEVMDTNEVKVGSTMSISSSSANNYIQIDPPEEIKVSSITKGYVLKIKNGSGTYTPTTGVKPISIVNVDITELLRNPDTLADITTYDEYTLKFVNTTATDQIIRIKRSAGTGAISDVDQKLNIIVEDTGTGKSTIERVDEIAPYDNYVIAIIVRELNPTTGKQGKVVKKMIDIYSYDVTANERR